LGFSSNNKGERGLKMVKYCTKCGNEIPDGTDFCIKCGSGIIDNPAASVETQSSINSQKSDIPHQPYQSQTFSPSPAITKRKSNKKIIVIAVVIVVIIFSIIGVLLLLGVFQDEKSKFIESKFIGEWTITDPTSGNAQGIFTFYDDGTFETSSGSTGNFKIDNGNICFIPEEDNVASNTSLCYDCKFSNDDKEITLKQNGTVIIILKKGISGSNQLEEEEEDLINNDYENAAIAASDSINNTIKVTLVVGGDNYDHNTGYASDDFMIFVDGFQVTDITDSWFVGGSWYIDNDNALASENPIGFESGSDHDVTVAIIQTVIFDGTISIS